MCRDFTLAVFHGRVRIFHHLYFNYQRIVQLLPHQSTTTMTTAGTTTSTTTTPPTILVTRLEHLWEDWKSVNVYLGQSADTVVIPTTAATTNNNNHTQELHLRDVSQTQLPVTKSISDQGRHALCSVLQKEYDAYFWLLRQAQNLHHPHDLAQALYHARQHCPKIQMNFQTLRTQ
jgi:hypothetical protein